MVKCAATHLRLGLTGGIGSGKSTVARRLSERGALVIDADAISRACTSPEGAAIPAIREAFGSDVILSDGSMDRTRMRERVFSDPTLRSRLEAIIHPIVARETAALVAGAAGRPIVFDVPLLVESGRWPSRVDYVWVVDCEISTQIKRVVDRNGWEASAVDAVIRQQAPRGLRLSAADAVLFNDGISLEELSHVVDTLAAEFGL